jgi:RHS repeat-associated protein
MDRLTQYGAGFGPDDIQCFRYDYLARLTDAWTPASPDCSANPTTAGLGGAAPYWNSYGYDGIGSRVQQVQHAAAGDTTSTSTYPSAGSPQPHELQTITTSGPAGSRTTSYTYDAIGGTLTRPGPAGSQTWTWDAERRPATVTEASGTSAYVYDADGNRLIAHDAAGATLYLPGTELHADRTGRLSATRSYVQDGETVATRTPQSLVRLVGDHQGTGAIAVRDTDYTFVKRYQDPYGVSRGTAVSWPTTRGFVGGVADPTGLVHLGAREYDAGTGRFISMDPILRYGDPQQVNGYTYADGSPVTSSDADGLLVVDCRALDEDECNLSRKAQGMKPLPPPPPPSHGTSSGSSGQLRCGDRNFIGPCPKGTPKQLRCGDRNFVGPCPTAPPKQLRCGDRNFVGPCPAAPARQLRCGDRSFMGPCPKGPAKCGDREFIGPCPKAPASRNPSTQPDKPNTFMVGYCVNFGLQLFWVASTNYCIVADSNGVFGSSTDVTPRGGKGLGAGAWLGDELMFSNARSKNDLGGPFNYGGYSAGPVSVTGSVGGDTSEAEFGRSIGLGGGEQSGVSYTVVSGYWFRW